MKKDVLKIGFTVIWIILALWLTIPVDDGRQIGDMWMEGGDLLVKTNNPTFFDNIGFFAILMIPVAIVWIWGLFKSDTKPKTQKRRSRMF
ncbi:MAG: hypothetical protein NXI08_01985 [bacterium]|nr:hypothetical protein [bacterium]